MSLVTKILSEEHGVGAKAGEKIACPSCHHQTFSIKPDDTIGKCFHPSCEHRIIPAEYHNVFKHSISEVLERFNRECHERLLDSRGKEGRNPYNYLTETRGIHPMVVEDSLIGVVPHGMGVKGWFSNVVQECQERVERLKTERSPGRPSYEEAQQLRRAEEALERAQKAQDALQQVAWQYPGWIALFFTDAKHRITAIRFRQPYTKEIRLVKFFPWLGVFGHGIYRPGQRHDEQTLLVTEGEFNALRLQSASIRYQEEQGMVELEYRPIIAVGGVTGADYGTIRRINRTPILFYDNDRSQAGFGLVTGAMDHMNVRAFTTPDVNTDPDEYVHSFRDDSLAWESVLELLEQSRWYYRTYDRVASDIRKVRQNEKNRKSFEVSDEVVDLIIQDLQERGTFFYDDADAYFLHQETKSLIPISLDGKSDWRSLLHRYGINATEQLFKYISEALYEHIKEHGEHTDVYNVSYFDKQTFTLYLSNHANQMYKITRDDIVLVDNGADGVLFQDHKAYEKFELVETSTDTSLIYSYLLKSVNFTQASAEENDTLTAEEKRVILLIWILATFFESVLPTKPLLLLQGVKGSSKTFALRKFGRVVYGRDFDVTGTPEKQENFDLDVARSSFLVLDNADSYASWLEDRLAALATGAKYTRRVLYSTAEMMDLRPKCFVALTSRTPKFRRDDVADRLIVLKLERRATFSSEQKMLAELHDHRNAIMTEIVSLLQYVVKCLQDYDDWDAETTFRMADFAIFALKFSRGNGTEDDIRAIFKQLSHEQKQFATEMDPTCILLEKWARIYPDRWVKSPQLCSDLTQIAREEHLDWHFSGKPSSFAQKWKQMRADYAEFFVIEEKAGASRAQLFRVALKDEYGEEQEPGHLDARRALAKTYGLWHEDDEA